MTSVTTLASEIECAVTTVCNFNEQLHLLPEDVRESSRDYELLNHEIDQLSKAWSLLQHLLENAAGVLSDTIVVALSQISRDVDTIVHDMRRTEWSKPTSVSSSFRVNQDR